MATVLVVDDEPIIRMAFAERLRDDGFTPLEAGTGEEALEHLGSGVKIDVAVIDLVMGGPIQGGALIKTVQDEYPHIGILVMSGDCTRLEGLRSSQAFLKPFSFDVAIEAIKRLID